MAADDRRREEDFDLEGVEGVNGVEADEELEVGRFQALLQDRRKLGSGLLLVVLIVVAIYVLFPKIVGADEALSNFDEAKWYWILVALGFNVVAFAAYVVLFRGVLGGTRDDDVHRRLDWRASYQITMAGLAATRIFSAAGAGGIVLTYWALRKAGVPRRRAACRMVAFLVLTYFVYTFALVVFGVLLRSGVLGGPAPLAGTVIPAAISGGLIILFLLIAAIPDDFERRIEHYAGGYRRARYLQRIAKGPATLAMGTRTAIAYIRHPSRGLLAVGGAGRLLGREHRDTVGGLRGVRRPCPVRGAVQGFFVGMAANLIPSPAGGVGAVDAGMIGAFSIFGIDDSVVFPAVLTYRVIAFWLPIPPGIVAFIQLRGTVARLGAGARRSRRPDGYTSESKVMSVETRKIEDVVIVGSGPAGYTAALYTSRADLHPLLIEGFAWGGLLQQTTDVENYPGYPEGVMGPQMMQDLRDQAERFGTRFITTTPRRSSWPPTRAARTWCTWAARRSRRGR